VIIKLRSTGLRRYDGIAAQSDAGKIAQRDGLSRLPDV
jgi:hypothetical protein